MSENVVARKEGGIAVLHCEACGNEDRLAPGRWDALNAFMEAHKACRTLPGP